MLEVFANFRVLLDKVVCKRDYRKRVTVLLYCGKPYDKEIFNFDAVDFLNSKGDVVTCILDRLLGVIKV